MHHCTKAEIREILELDDIGYTVAEIANKMGIYRKSVYRILGRNNRGKVKRIGEMGIRMTTLASQLGRFGLNLDEI